jgi:polar amino acid transport system substrate-binding protein
MKHSKLLLFALLCAFAACQMPKTEPQKEASKAAAPAKKAFEFCVLEYDTPFSASKPDEKTGLTGFYVNVGEAIAKELGMEAKPYFVMASFNARPVREGLLAGHCAAQIGLPRTDGKWFTPKKVQLTQKFGSMGYALVYPKDKKFAKMSDLRGKKIATQTGSPAHIGLDMVKGVKYTLVQAPEDAMKALAEGTVEAALIWGTTAGYQNKYYYDNRFTIVPTNYKWDVAIGITAANDSLATQIDAALIKLQPDIEKLSSKYGFPAGKPFLMPELPFTKEEEED